MLGGAGTRHKALSGHFHPLSWAWRGRASVLPKSPWGLHPPAPLSALALGGPSMDPAPPIICWKVQWRRGRSSCRAPRLGRLVALPQTPPPSARPHFLLLSCPLLLYLEKTCCNKS